MNKKVKEVIAKELIKVAKDLVGGCDKLPEGGMRDNCEKKKKENKDKKASRLVEGLDKNKSDNLAMLTLLNKAMSAMPGSPQQKKLINKLNVYRKNLGLKSLTANANRVGRLVKRHEKLLDKWAESNEGQRHIARGVVSYDDLPRNLISQLERIKDTETLWSDVERYLGDIQSAGHSFVKPLWGSKKAGVDNTHILKELEKDIKYLARKDWDDYSYDDLEWAVDSLDGDIDRIDKLIRGWASGGSYLVRDFKRDIEELRDIYDDADDEYIDGDRTKQLMKRDMVNNFKKLFKEMKNMQAM